MQISFIRPNMGDYRAVDAMEPLVFAILRGLTPEHISTRLYDERLAPISYDNCDQCFSECGAARRRLSRAGG